MKNIWNLNTPRAKQKQIDKTNYLSIKRFRRGLSLSDARVPSGAYSVYYRRGKIGIKVLRTDFRYFGTGGYKSMRSLKRSFMWCEALKEYNLMKRAEDSNLVPIPYCVKPVRLGKRFYPAIFMEHIQGTRFDFFCDGFNRKEFREAQKFLEAKEIDLTHYGVDHVLDSGGGNAIVVESIGRKIIKVKLIDFSPGVCQEV